jgi:hypothetical protein
MPISGILGAGIEGRKATIRMDNGRHIPLSFRARIRRITTYDLGQDMIVETIDGKITRFTAEQLRRQSKVSA